MYAMYRALSVGTTYSIYTAVSTSPLLDVLALRNTPQRTCVRVCACVLPLREGFSGGRRMAVRTSRSHDKGDPCFFCCFSRTGRATTRRARRSQRRALPRNGRRRHRTVRSNGLLTGALSSSSNSRNDSGGASFGDNSNNGEEKIMSFEEFQKAFVPSAPGGDGGGGGGASTASLTGISWRSLAGDVLTQPLFFGIFALLATPAIRESSPVE